jgi:hypothetical protein
MIFPWELASLTRSRTAHYVNQAVAWQYEYWVHIEGVAAADRLKYAISSNTIPLVSPLKYLEFYYFFLQPGKNFLPLDYDYGNLPDLVAGTPPPLKSSIIDCNSVFLERYLSMKSIEEYLRAVITRYTSFYNLRQ